MPAAATVIDVSRATTAADLDAARALFEEYVRATGWEAAFASYLAQQSFARELDTLGDVYAPPHSVLLLARADGAPAGCVACKPLEPPAVCEMKRLYVRPAFRALGVGEALVRRIMAEARDAGYRRMRLDTLPSMRAAQRLYARLGFVGIPPYCENPVAGSHFLECDLGADGR